MERVSAKARLPSGSGVYMADVLMPLVVVVAFVVVLAAVLQKDVLQIGYGGCW